MLDPTDVKILELLQENSRSQWKDIGKKVHMTGQAVAARIHRLEDLGVIQGFTIRVDPVKLGKPLVFFVTVYMKSNDHQLFQNFISSRSEIVEACRTSGGGCYLLKGNIASNEELNKLLDEILRFGNYSVSLSIAKIK